MITVISGTNRAKSKTRVVAETYKKLLEKHADQPVEILTLEDIPTDFISGEMYEEEFQNQKLGEIQDRLFIPAEKLVFVVPEYNGSFPGIFKLFIDAISIRNYKENFEGKKVCLIGVASGRAGNLRGLDHLTTSLNYLKMNIYHNRFPIPQIEKAIDKKGEISDKVLLAEMEALAEDFLHF